MEKTENNSYKNAELYAIKYLSYKSRTETEVYKKLLSYGEFDAEIISKTVLKLKELGYINDKKYAELFAASKSANRLDGRHKIIQKLLQKGIDLKIAEAALNNIEASGDFDEAANAARLIEKKTRGACSLLDYREKKKIFDYLARKGYSYSVIVKAFKIAGSEIETENIEWD